MILSLSKTETLNLKYLSWQKMSLLFVTLSRYLVPQQQSYLNNSTNPPFLKNFFPEILQDKLYPMTNEI